MAPCRFGKYHSTPPTRPPSTSETSIRRANSQTSALTPLPPSRPSRTLCVVSTCILGRETSFVSTAFVVGSFLNSLPPLSLPLSDPQRTLARRCVLAAVSTRGTVITSRSVESRVPEDDETLLISYSHRPLRKMRALYIIIYCASFFFEISGEFRIDLLSRTRINFAAVVVGTQLAHGTQMHAFLES